MIVSSKLLTKQFISGVSSKEAYLELTKWIATEIMAKMDSKNLTYSIRKIKGDVFKFELQVFTTFDDTDEVKLICNRCQEFHHLFYINAQFNCNKCNMMGYRSNMDHILTVNKRLRKEEATK